MVASGSEGVVGGGAVRGGDDPIEKFGGGEDAGDAGAGVGAGPAKVEAFDVLGNIVGSEPSALGENGFELERGTDMGIETGFKIGRGKKDFADEMLAEVGDEGFFEGGEDPIGVLLLDLIPVDFIAGGAAMGNGGENIKTFVAGRGEGGVGAGGGVEVEREVLGQVTMVENIVEEALVPWAEPDGVVGEFGIGAVGAEINQEEGHAVAHPAEAGIRPFAAMSGGDTLLVEVGDIGVGDHDLGAENFAGAEADAGGGTVFNEKFLDRRIEAELAAEILEQFDEGLDEGAGSAHGEVHPPFAFEIVDHGVNGGGLKGIPADEERMEGKHLAQALVFDVTAGHLPDRAIRAKAHQVGGDAEHIGKMGEGLVGQFDEGALKDGVGFPDKFPVALEIAGGEAANLLLHFGLVAGVFKGDAVMPGDAIEGFAGDDAEVVGRFFARKGEKFVEEKGGGEDGGAGVVGESLIAKDGGTTSGLLQGLQQGDIVSAGLKADGGGEATETGADDEGGAFQGRPPTLAKLCG